MGTDHKTTLRIEGTGSDKTRLLPHEISAMILRALQRAETVPEVTQAVITVPAYFTDAQRQATKTAGEIGFRGAANY